MTAQPATPREVIARALAAAWDEGDDYGVLDEACEICYSTEEIEAAIRSLNPEGEPQEAVEAK